MQAVEKKRKMNLVEKLSIIHCVYKQVKYNHHQCMVSNILIQKVTVIYLRVDSSAIRNCVAISTNRYKN